MTEKIASRGAGANVVVVTHDNVAPIFDFVIEACRSRGLNVRVTAVADVRSAPSLLAAADVLLVSSNFPCSRAALAAAPKLRAVIFGASGTESIDIDAATELGIVIGYGATPENSESMAEATVLLMLALLYDLKGSERAFHENLPRPPIPQATMLKGKTVGFVGFGRIARAVAHRLSTWGVRMSAYTPRPATSMPADVASIELDELLATSDIVTVHASLNDESFGLIDRSRLRLMKPGAFVINTARGGIVDEAALCAAIHEGWIAGLALDAFVTEPPPLDCPLRRLERTILTPHRVGHTIDTIRSLQDTAVENIARVLRAEPPLHVRNPAVLAAWTARWAMSDDRCAIRSAADGPSVPRGAETA
jgi:phosphoglycerate dehydrogenase-like enzyme